ncbi:MAG TPA: YncE family protein, partial [Thermoplasmata archaeon]|nr:YncE family protein [Thermoplasmata archaeon]
MPQGRTTGESIGQDLSQGGHGRSPYARRLGLRGLAPILCVLVLAISSYPVSATSAAAGRPAEASRGALPVPVAGLPSLPATPPASLFLPHVPGGPGCPLRAGGAASPPSCSPGGRTAASVGSNSSPVAERGSYDGGVTVGEYPLGVAVDPRTGWVYVANSVGNSVSILNGSTLLTTVGVGSAPFGVAYDPYYGWVYVTDSGSGQVSVLNGTRVIQTITVQSTPEGIAVDPGTGEAYVAEASTNNVTVLSGQSVVTNLAAGMGPDGVAYSSWNGDFYVADNVGNTVTVLNGTSRVAVIRVGAGPGGIAFDAVNGYTYVTNLQAGNVSAIYGVNFIQNVSVQLGPDGVAIDGANGLAYVTNQANNSVSVINVTSNIGTIGAGTDPHGAAYDPANGMIYVADYGSDSVSMISTVLGIAPPIVTDRGNDVAASDVNQTLTVTADLWGPGSGTDLLSEYLHPSKGFGCGPTPNLTATGTTWIVSLQCTPASPGVYSLWLNVTDGDRSKVWSTVTVPVDPALLLPPPNFTSLYLDGVAVADVNQSVGMLADPSGGSGVYVSFAWSGLSGRPCQSVATARPTCRFPSVGLYEIGVEVTDSNQAVVQSLNSPLQIDPLPFVGKPSANRSSADVNEPVRFSESVSGGAGSLNYVWTGFGGQRCSGLSSASPVCAFVAP